MRLLSGAVVALALVVAATAVTGAQGYDKKTTEKMLGDGARKLASADPAEREQGMGFILGYITCAYRAQYQPLIVKALKDPNPKVRSSALQTLEKVAAKDAIPDIAVLLEDPVKDVYERAGFTLGTIGDPSAVPFLTKVRDNARAQKKTMIADMMQEGLDEISGKSPTEHTKCP
jgi:hypothetical protein